MVKYILLPFKGLIKAMGVDYHQLCLILTTKLRMDNRRRMSMSQKGKSDSNHQLLLQTFAYGFIGVLMGMVTISISDFMVSYTIFFSFIMIMIAMLMISEFTNVLIDTRDNSILMSRPINSRTLVLAKILHIAFYMLHMSLSLSLFTIITTWANHGFIAMLFFFLLICLTALFTLFLTNIFYLGLMNVVNGQKLKDIIVYFQIAMAILFMGAYQLLPRIMDIYDVTNIHMPIHWWTYLIPSVWMSGSFSALASSTFDASHLTFLVSALLIPVLSLIFVIKVLAPKFNKALSQIDVGDSKKKEIKQEKQKSKGFIGKISRLFTKNRVEESAFKMVWIMSGRERKYKQSVYPSFGYIFIFILIFAFQSNDTFDLQALAQSKKYLWFIYMPIIITFSITQQLGFSDQSKSNWFYKALPINQPGDILLGAFKSVMVKHFIPIYLIISAVVTGIWGAHLIDDMIYGFLSITLVTSLIQSWSDPTLPFSKERETMDAGGNFLKGILLMISAAAIGGLHYGLGLLPYGILIGIPVLSILLFFRLKSFRNIRWERIIE